MYTPEELYDRIVEVRRRDNVSADVACERVAKTLNWNVIGRDCGVWFLTQVERQYFRTKGYTGGGQVAGDIHSASAPAHTDNGDHTDSDAQTAPVPNTNGGHIAHDTQIYVAADIQGEGAAIVHAPPMLCEPTPSPAVTAGDQMSIDAHEVNVASENHERSGGQSEPDSQRTRAPGTPWMLRVNWNWDAEVALPSVGRKAARNITKLDIRTAKNTLHRRAATMMDYGNTLGRLEQMMERDDETLHDAWQRSGSALFRTAMKRLVEQKDKAA